MPIRRPVAAVQVINSAGQYSHAKVFCDDGSVWMFRDGDWSQDGRPRPGSLAASERGRAAAESLNTGPADRGEAADTPNNRY
jgi:hypothetical protein